MGHDRKATVLYFEDSPAHHEAFHRKALPDGWALSIVTALQYCARSYQAPSLDQPPIEAIQETRVAEGISFDQHIEQLLSNYAYIVVDLQLPNTDCRCDFCGENFPGLHVLRIAHDRDWLHRIFVSSAKVSDVEREAGNSWRLFEKCRQKGVSVFDKARDEEYENLKQKLQIWSLFEGGNYEADFKTRSDLFLAGTRGRREKPEHVLITGPSGTGKEDAARLIHTIGGPEEFVSIPCGALSEELAQSYLFGHVKGSYTGAVSHKGGRLLSAIGWREPVEKPAKRVDRKEIQTAIEKLESDLQAVLGPIPNVHSPAVTDQAKLEIAKNALQAAGTVLIKYVGGEFSAVESVLRAYAGTSLSVSLESQADYRIWLLKGGYLEEDGINLRIKSTAPTGTVFLDEFQDLPKGVQALLMRVMETGEMEPFGFNGKVILKDKSKDGDGRLHIRFVGATNSQAVAALAKTGVATDCPVRQDLVFRLACWHVEMPALRADEVGALIDKEMNDRSMNIQWEPTARERLVNEVRAHPDRFPGHRRQVRQVVLRAAAYAEFDKVSGVPKASALNKVGVAHVERALDTIELKPNTNVSDSSSRVGDISEADDCSSAAAPVQAQRPEGLVTYQKLADAIVGVVTGLASQHQDKVERGEPYGKSVTWLPTSTYAALKAAAVLALTDELGNWQRPDENFEQFVGPCVTSAVATLDDKSVAYVPKSFHNDVGRKHEAMTEWLMAAGTKKGWVTQSPETNRRSGRRATPTSQRGES